MKKIMNRALSLILTAAMILSLSQNAFPGNGTVFMPGVYAAQNTTSGQAGALLKTSDSAQKAAVSDETSIDVIEEDIDQDTVEEQAALEAAEDILEDEIPESKSVKKEEQDSRTDKSGKKGQSDISDRTKKAGKADASQEADRSEKTGGSNKNGKAGKSAGSGKSDESVSSSSKSSSKSNASSSKNEEYDGDVVLETEDSHGKDEEDFSDDGEIIDSEEESSDSGKESAEAGLKNSGAGDTEQKAESGDEDSEDKEKSAGSGDEDSEEKEQSAGSGAGNSEDTGDSGDGKESADSKEGAENSGGSGEGASEGGKSSEDKKETEGAEIVEDDDEKDAGSGSGTAEDNDGGDDNSGKTEHSDSTEKGNTEKKDTEKKDTEKKDTENTDKKGTEGSKKEEIEEDSGSESAAPADRDGGKASQNPAEGDTSAITEDSTGVTAGDEAAASAKEADVELRSITAEVVEIDPYARGGETGGINENDGGNAETFVRAESFWQALFDRAPVPSADREGYEKLDKKDLTVQISGMLPEGVTAVVYAVPFTEDATWSETALMALDVVLYDRDGNLYVPKTGLELIFGGNIIKKTVKAQMPVLIYNFEENEKRAEKKKTYAADAAVYRDGTSYDDRLRYRTDGKKDSGKAKWTKGGLVFAEDENGLVTYTDNTLGITATAAAAVLAGSGSEAAGWNGPLHLIVSTQENDRTLSAKDGDTKVTVRGALSKTTKASLSLDSSSDAASDSRSGKSGSEELFAVDITLSDKEAGQYEPDLPVTVTISDPAIREALQAGSKIEVYRVAGDGGSRAADSVRETSDTIDEIAADEESGTETVAESARNSGDSTPGLEKIEITDIDGSSVQFEAQGPLSYVIKIITASKKLTASDGSEYLVTVSYDTASGIPENAQLDVREIKAGEEGYDDYVAKSAKALGTVSENLAFARAFDIKLTDPETGEKYQPAKDVKVSIQLLNQEIGEDEEIRVVHFEQKEGQGRKSGSSPRVMASSVKGETVEFETNGFSVYVVTGENPVPRRTYNFYIEKIDVYEPYMFVTDSGERTSSQTVRDGQVPVIPSPDTDGGRQFKGWYERTDSAGEGIVPADQPYDFNSPVTEDEVIHLYAVFTDFSYVIFHDQYDNDAKIFPIADTRRGVPEEGSTKAKVKISDVSTTYTGGRDMAFFGWSQTKITTPGAERDDEGNPVQKVETDENGCIEITGETHLYPIYKAVKWLSFWSGPTGSGATYFPAQYCFGGAGPASLPVPEWEGHTFTGWYAGTLDSSTGTVTYGANPLSNPDGSLINGATDGGMSVYEGALHLSENATLYAKWDDGTTASYRIIIWKQKASASADTEEKYKYDFVESVIKTVPAGSIARVDDDYKNYASTKTEFSGYTCRWDEDVEPVDENGRTILNVYYDRSGDHQESGTAHSLVFKNSADDSTIQEYESVDYNTDLLTGNNGESFVPEEQEQKRAGYIFTGWFADSNCTTQVFFSQSSLDAYTGRSRTVLYNKMPDEDLTIYAGWEEEWYLVRIDPNYGAFNGTGSTWFWRTIKSGPIQEYTQVTRDYEESSSGEYYYVKHDREYYGYNDNSYYNNEPAERDARYTKEPGEATEYKTFEKVPGLYSYAGWFEVHEDGSETPYDFSKPVDHHTYLRLHWKKTGTYYLRYITGEGEFEDGTKEAVDEEVYADNADIVITRGAAAPEGYTFVGWKVQGSQEETTYAVGELFTLHSDDAVSISGKETVTLEAVYVKPKTAKIIYDFNGGSFGGAPADFDYGRDPLHPVTLEKEMDDVKKTATVSNILNNSNFVLSEGTGLTREGAVFKGWSASQVYNPDTDTLFMPGQEYGVDTEEPVTLYAVWGFRLTYHLNVPEGEDPQEFGWGDSDKWTAGKYTSGTVQGEQVYYREVFPGNPVPKAGDNPSYSGTGSRMFRFWTDAPDGTSAYPFSDPVEGALDLYAYWSDPVTVTVHAVDATDQTLAEKNADSGGWTIQNISVGTEVVDIPGAEAYVTPPAGSVYEFAFAAAHSPAAGLQTISENEKIRGVYYSQDAGQVFVKFADTSRKDAPLDACDIYFVYFEKKSLPILYKSMPPEGTLETVTVSGSAPETTGVPGEGETEYVMTNLVTQPKGWVADQHAYAWYSFAVGSRSATTAADLSVFTTASDSDDSRPVLRVKQTWRGFLYTTESGENAGWVDYGYDPVLYVVYYDQYPTIVMFSEKTVGISQVMDRQFTYDLLVMEKGTVTESVQKQMKKSDTEWEDVGEPVVTATDISPRKVYDTRDEGNQPFLLKNGEANSSILFYSAGVPVRVEGDEYVEDGHTYRDVTTRTTTTTQTAEITQTEDGEFTTKVDSAVENETAEPFKYKYTSDGTKGTIDVTFTNTHREVGVEVHVACIENGSIRMRDDLRSQTAEDYSFALPISTQTDLVTKDLLTELPSSGVYTDQTGNRLFGAIAYGSDDGDIVTLEQMGVVSVAYGPLQDGGNLYDILLKDSSGALLGGLGARKLYYLYYPAPRIQYVRQNKENELSLIRGSTDGTSQTNTITYNGAAVTMNGLDVVQDQRVEVPLEGLQISQETGVSKFKMPPVLDDGTYRRYLSYTRIGVGTGISSPEETINISTLGDNVSDYMKMQLQIRDNDLYWSFDGNTWTQMDETKTIFAIYTERGYDLQISKIVDTSVSGANPIFTDRKFTVTIEPAAGGSFNKNEYEIEGYSTGKVSVEDGKITLTAEDGSKFKLHGLGHGTYKITESNNENFDLSVKSGPIVSPATKEETVTDSSVTFALDEEKQLVLTNSPSAICEVTQGDEVDGPVFYTLRDAVQYVIDNIADGTANIAMLTDYLMPAADTMEIPSGAHITLTTATEGTHKYPDATKTASIRRSAELTAEAMITSQGELTLKNITLDGMSLAASAPMIRSTGAQSILTVDRGTKLQNAENSGNGGAIYASGTVTLSGPNANYSANRAAKGGVLYYDGTGEVTISGGIMTGNSASESGGAVYARAGRVTMSGGTIGGTGTAGNSAVKGGAFYAENAGIVLSGGTITGNSASESGGAVHSQSGSVEITGDSTSVANNTAAEDGGAVYAGTTGTVKVSGGSLSGNTAAGNGGAICTASADVTISGGTIGGTGTDGNSAEKGGAVYTGTGLVTVSGGSVSGNTAASDGGAIYTLSGDVNISGASTSIYSNVATGGNGGAVYSDSGAVTLSDAKLYTNNAANGFGGAIYTDSSSVTVNSGVVGGDNGGNRAINGAGIYINTGSGTFTAGLIKNNIASQGGAVGVGSDSARLNFSGTATIQNNTLGEGNSAPASNVYLDQDTDAVINTPGMSSGGYVGIYVPGAKTADLFKKRGDVGAEFGVCSGNATTISQFHNDRETNLKAVVNSITKKIYWSSGIKVEVRYLANYSGSLPTGTNGDSKYSNNNYYPASGSAAISLLADELRGSVSNLSLTSVYATALLQDDSNYDHYLTRLLWEDGKWKVERRDGSKAELGSKKIILYYSEPTYFSIENNTAFELELSPLTVKLAGQDRSLLNSASETGFGLVFARNGMIQEELLPVPANEQGKLVLPANGGSINILIPGGGGRNYSLTGNLVNGSGTVQLRRTGEQTESIQANQQVVRTGTTASNSNTYEVIFGEDKPICRIWCATQASATADEYVAKYDYTTGTYNGTTEYTFSKMMDAVNFAKNHGLTDVTIEMLVDYLMPGSDVVLIATADAFESVTFTTAVTGEFQYPGTDSTRRATISRGIGNEQPLISINGRSNSAVETTVTVHDLDFDGKNLVGECEGGAVATKDCKVEIEDAGFINCNSYNGGATYISYGTMQTAGPNKKYVFATGYDSTNATVTITNATFANCVAQKKYGRSGGGGIWTNAKTFTATTCSFTNCKSQGDNNMQGGAVFHRIESADRNSLGVTPYYAESQTRFNDCTFTGCVAQGSGGAMESDATDVQLYNCIFTNCSTKYKDGGAMNIYLYEQDGDMNYNSIPSKLYLKGCSFVSCTGYRNGGAVRSMAVDNEFENCTFTNTIQTGSNNGYKGGGAIYVSNNRSVTTTVTGCSFTGAVANNGPGGAICTYSKELRVSGTTITNCQSKNSSGGGIYHAVTSTKYPSDSTGLVNNVGSFASLTDCTITGCTASKSGGGLYTNAFNARTVASTEKATYNIDAVAVSVDEAVKLLDSCVIENCKANGEYGGGVYLDSSSMSFATVVNSTIRDCTANWSGGGLYSKALHLTISGNSTNNTVISGCKSVGDNTKGGGIFHSRDNSEFIASYCSIESCSATQYGGGIYTNKASETFANCLISNNTAGVNGGGLCHDTNATLSLTDTTVSGNKAGGQGGGIYTKKYLTLVRTIIEKNQLTSNTIDNAAGVYMTNDGILVIGETEASIDNSAVMDNKTLNGSDSNLRLPVETGSKYPENKKCVTVNCGLGKIDGKGGYIGVTNAWKAGTQFGTSNVANPSGLEDPDGVTVRDVVFNADTSTLYGIIDRQDNTRKKIIWAGPPICKITDQDGKLLYFKNNGSDPCIFDVLEDGAASGRTSAFSLLRGTPKLYYAPEEENGTGTQYQGSVFVIKMLVEKYALTTQITTVDRADKTIILTTAGKKDTDGYPFDKSASGTRATITRGENVTGSMAVVSTNMQFRNVVLDGRTGDSVTTVTDNGAIVKISGEKDIKVELQSMAIFQYGNTEGNGGAVNVENGFFRINGGLIRFCDAGQKGGAVYVNVAARTDPQTGYSTGFSFDSGNIQKSNAADGAGVYLNDGEFNMSGGTISGCAAGGSGGGVFVADGKTMNMTGGFIGYEEANTAATKGGGIAVGGAGARLNFSGQVNVSKNTCDASEATGKICNVELDLDTKEVINTSGLYSRSYIGVYVPGHRDDENPDNDGSPYKERGGEEDPFGTFTGRSSQLYCFVNDRNGLKGGLIANPDPNTIYWIKIFSVEISKEVETSENVADQVREKAESQYFWFTVRLWDTDENVSGIKVADIAQDILEAQEAGEESRFGNIPFVTAGDGIISARIRIKKGVKYAAENLPDGLGYDVTEDWTPGYSNIPENITSPVNFRTGKTGENKNVPGVNPYVSEVVFTNIQPVCKITDASGNLLYRNPVGGNIGNGQQTPAVYIELDKAFAAMTGNLFPLNSRVSYSGAYRVEMLVPEYLLPAKLSPAINSEITLTTAEIDPAAASSDARDNYFGYCGYLGSSAVSGKASIKRSESFTDDSMIGLSASKRLKLTNIKLDGNNVTADTEGGLVYVSSGAVLTAADGAELTNSRTSQDGAGVYLAERSQLHLSGRPAFGGKDTEYGYLLNQNGNFRADTLTGKKNGTQSYSKAHQDIFIAGYEGSQNAASLVIDEGFTADPGSIWVWAEKTPHYLIFQQFAKIKSGASVEESSLKAFRNARDDETSANETSSYLYGLTTDGNNVIWSGTFVCKITAGTQDRTLLYYKVGDSYCSAVFSRLAAAFTNINAGNVYVKSGNSYTTYNGALNVEMLVPDYTMTEAVPALSSGKDVTLTTADYKAQDGFPYNFGINAANAVVRRGGFTDSSMFKIYGELTFSKISLSGEKGKYTSKMYGGIVYVNNGGSLTIAAEAKLKDSNAEGNGGAVYLADGGAMTMTAGTITGNSVGDGNKGAAVYISKGASLTMTGGSITGNTVSAASRAVEMGGASASLNFSGSPTIYDNKYDENGTEKQANVCLDLNNINMICVAGSGLTDGAKIGVWPTKPQNQDAGEPFGNTLAAGANEKLAGFYNDYQYNEHGITFVGWPKTAGEQDTVIWRPLNKRVEIYRYKKGELAQTEAAGPEKVFYYAFTDFDNYISVTDIVSAVSNAGSYNPTDGGYQYGTAMIDSIIEVLYVRADGNYKVKDVSVEQTADASETLKVFYFKTDNLVPLIIRKVWNTPDSVEEHYRNDGVGYTIKDGSGNIVSSYSNDKISDAELDSGRIKGDNQITVGSGESRTWQKVVYVPKKELYSIEETDSSGNNLEPVYSYVEETDNNNKTWVNLSEWDMGFLQITCNYPVASGRYSTARSIALLYKDADEVYYRSTVNFPEEKNLAVQNKTYYIPLPVPKYGDVQAFLLAENDGHGYLSGDGLSGAYGISVMVSKGRGDARFSYAKQVDDGNGAVVAFSNLAVLEKIPNDKPTSAWEEVNIVHESVTLEVFSRRTLTMTNSAICKIVDKNNTEHVFGTLRSALTWARTNMKDDDGKVTAAIEMLVDYAIPSSDYLTGNDYRIKSNETITIKTAKSGTYRYSASGTGNASITRTQSGGSLFETAGSLTLTDITLDGGNKLARPLSSNVNGGLISVLSGGTLNVTEGAALQNSTTSGNGGAVYVAAGGAMTMDGGTITGNSCTGSGNGAGIYLAYDASASEEDKKYGRLELSGSPAFGGTRVSDGKVSETTGNIKQTSNPNGSKNGNAEYNYPQQDIFLAGPGTEIGEDRCLPALVLKDNLSDTVQNGSIWVYAGEREHYYMLEQFAVLADDFTGTVSEATYKAFRNARADSETDSGGVYLTGQAGPDLDDQRCVYWTGGFDVAFKKIDGYGNPLGGARFTLYKTFSYIGSDKTVSLSEQTGYEGTSAAADDSGTGVQKGTVTLQKVPTGIYYMKESNAGTDADPFPTSVNGGKTFAFKNENAYVVLVGEANLRDPDEGGAARTGLWAADTPSGAVLADITFNDIKEQRGEDQNTHTFEREYAIFLIDKETGKAVANPDVASFGILNEAALSREVILKKVSETYAPLENARFRIFRADLSEYTEGQPTDDGGSKKGYYESGSAGVYFTGKLPLGKYYLVETQVPDPLVVKKEDGTEETTEFKEEDNLGRVFILQVDWNGMAAPAATGSVIEVEQDGKDVVTENLKKKLKEEV